MSDDARRILDLLAQGKITVDEAEGLLKALGAASARPASGADARSAPRARYIRIEVKRNRARADSDRRVYAWPGCMGVAGAGPREVNIRVPLSVVRSGMRLGAMFPGGGDVIAQALRDRGVNVDDLSKISPEQLETLLKEMGEITVDVDQGRAQVRISAE